MSETFNAPMTESGWSYADGVATGSGVRAMKMIHEMTDYVKRGRWYDITFTLSGYAGGQVRAFAGVTMPSQPPGSWETAASLTPVPDRFTMEIGQGLVAGGVDLTVPPFNLTGPGNSAEDIGSMRIFCTHAKFGLIDPLALPGLSGAGHIHEFVGNSAITEDTTYEDLRNLGATTCMDVRGVNAKYPVNPTAYWWPAVLDGVGNVIRQNQTLVYYKGPSKPGLNYAGHSPYGGLASANGTTTITRTSGALFNTANFPLGSTLHVGPNSYTVSSITDTDHMVLSGTVSTGTDIVYDIFSKELKDAAGYLCNESWGQTSLTVDQLGNVVTDETRCPQIPHGMKFIFGYNKANGQGRPDVAVDITSGDNGTGAVTPSGTQGAIAYSLRSGPDAGPEGAATWLSPNFDTLADIMAWAAANPASAPLGSVLHVDLAGPPCWDGYHIDSPDHRSHVAYAVRSTPHVGNQRCPESHPYRMPHMSVQNYYTIDQAFLDGKWRLSIDEMVHGLPAGAGAHMDYWWAWSPDASDGWFERCYHPHNSCTNDLGDGTQVPGPKNYDGSDPFCNACAKNRPDRYVRVENFGMSWDFTEDGTYTVRVKAQTDGVWGFMGFNDFEGSISGMQIEEVPAGAVPA